MIEEIIWDNRYPVDNVVPVINAIGDWNKSGDWELNPDFVIEKARLLASTMSIARGVNPSEDPQLSDTLLVNGELFCKNYFEFV